MHPEEYPSRIAIRKVIAEGLLLYRQRASTLFILALLAVGTGQACLLFAAAFVRPQQFPLRALIGAAMMLTPLAAWLTLAETFAVTEERTRLQQVLLKPYGKCWRYIANATILSLLLAAIQVVPIFGYLFYAWFWLRLGLYVVILCVEPLDHHWLQPLSRSWKMMHGHVRTFFVAAIPPFLGLIPGLIFQHLAFNQVSLEIGHPAFVLASAVALAIAMPWIVTTQVAMYRAIRSEEQTA